MRVFGLKDKHALITGGASGIGRATAERMAEAGAKVSIADRDGEGAKAAISGGVALTLDVRDEAAVEKAMAGLDPLDILVNSAGILQNPVAPGELSMAEWDRVVAVNLRGTYVMCRAVGTAMNERGGGAIVNIASVAGVNSAPVHAYGPAKAGVISLTRSLAAQWGRAGVRVNAVSPGFTRTQAVERSFELGALSEDAVTGSTALGRLLEADEVAAAVLFLASPLASGVTGVNLSVDAGHLAAVSWSAYGGD